MSVPFWLLRFVGIRGKAASELAQSPPPRVSAENHIEKPLLSKADSTTQYQNFANLLQFCLRESWWGCHPKPAFWRLAPLEKLPTKGGSRHEKYNTPHRHRVIQTRLTEKNTPSFRACFPMQNEPSRIYPTSLIKSSMTKARTLESRGNIFTPFTGAHRYTTRGVCALSEGKFHLHGLLSEGQVSLAMDNASKLAYAEGVVCLAAAKRGNDNSPSQAALATL